MKKFGAETAVGIFFIIGFLCFAYLSVELGQIPLFGSNQYPIYARFDSISGLKEGATIEIAGVKVGKVGKITLKDYQADVELLMDKGIKLQEDAIASVRTQGIIGDKYIKISPGGSSEYLKPGGTIIDTESAIDIEELISKYIFQKS
jgi:phospholipid/cholesterol/gamma-HCH transport system substrate-binding protein